MGCGGTFSPTTIRQRYCTLRCFNRFRVAGGGKPSRATSWGIPRPNGRKVQRPAYEELIQDVEELGYCEVARRYVVSDNAIRK